MQVTDRRAKGSDTANLHVNNPMRMPKEDMRDKRFLQADFAEPHASHEGAEKVPR